MSIFRRLWLFAFMVIAGLLLGTAPAEASRFGLHVLHKTPTGTLLSPTYDSRYGTNTAQSAIDGWFDFSSLRGGNRRVWVNSSGGNDANSCLSAVLACATLDHAFPIFIAGTGSDQLMIAGTGGRTYISTLTASTFSGFGGVSATYPTAVLSYDPADASNAAKYGRLTGASQPVIQIGGTRYDLGASFQEVSCGGSANFAFQGLTFDGMDGDGPGITWQCPHNNVVFQNDKFLGLQLTINSGVSYDATAASYNQGGNISKSAFYGGWAGGSNMQGAYIHATNNFYLQDNVWWHVGWRIGSSRDDTGPNGGAFPTNHAHYIGASNAGTVVSRNFYADSSGDGENVRGNGTITSSASLDEPEVGYIGAFSGSFHEAPNGILQTVDDWLMMGGAPYNSGAGAGYGPWNTNTLSGSHLINVAAFDNPTPRAFITSYNGGNAQNIVSITHVGTTATVTTDVSHGITTGDHVYVDFATPSDYNVSNVAVTVTGATTFTYSMITTPATNATVVGKYTPQVPQYLLVDKLHSYNYSTSFENINWVTTQIHNTYTNIISDQLAPGGGNSTSNGSTFTGYKTRDQVVTAVLTGIGITPGANYYVRKGQLINAAITRPDLPWSRWLIGVAFPAMNLTPTYTTPAYSTFTDTAFTTYKTTLTDLTISSSTFVHGVSKTVLLSGAGASPTLSSSDLPAGCTLSARSMTCNAVSAGTPTIHILETSQDGTATHTTPLALTISFLPLFGFRRRRKAVNDNQQMELAA